MENKNKKVTIIGIAGGTGSGKTTVVKKIVEMLPPHYVTVVPLDSYYNDTTGMTQEERSAINFDHPDAFDWKLLIKQVNELRHGHAIEQPTYSYILSNRLPETIHVDPKPVIIIEGIMTLLNKTLRDMMDLKVFVDCDSDERLIRNIQRDTIDRGRTVSMVVDRYLKVLKPMHEQFIEPTKRYADLIIPQGGENVKGIGILCNYIEGLVPKKKEKKRYTVGPFSDTVSLACPAASSDVCSASPRTDEISSALSNCFLQRRIFRASMRSTTP